MPKRLVSVGVGVILAASSAGSARADSSFPGFGGSWQGLHAGLNAGGGLGNTDVTSSFYLFGAIAPDSPISPEAPHFGTSGFLGGGQVGYDWQLGSFVLGAEADFSGSTVTGSRSSSGVDIEPYAFTETQKNEVSWLTTLRARAGYAVSQQWLPYVTAGFAAGGVRGSQNTTFATGVVYQSSTSTVRTGPAIGAGLDYALAPNWIARFEYVRVSLDKFGTMALEAPVGPYTKSTTFATQLNILRVGADWKF